MQDNKAVEISADGNKTTVYQGKLTQDKFFLGSSAEQVERSLGINGEEILYVGDHIYSDVNVSKKIRRWRTALILSELEEELQAQQEFIEQEKQLIALMEDKAVLELEHANYRTLLQRLKHQVQTDPSLTATQIKQNLQEIKEKVMTLDQQIQDLAVSSSALVNANWGLLMRTGNDKSHLARQLERHADIYTSRVSNFYYRTPFAYFRSVRGILPHDVK